MTTSSPARERNRLVTAQKPRSWGRNQGNFGLAGGDVSATVMRSPDAMSTVRRLRPSPSSGWPALVICGLPATGKSSLAAAAARSLRVPSVSSDLVRKELAEPSGLSRGDASFAQVGGGSCRVGL